MQETPYKDLLLSAPPEGDALPHVTPAMLADEFAEQGVLLGGSANEHRVLRWFVPLSRLNTNYMKDSPVQVANLMLAADPEDIPTLAKRFPEAYLITQVSSANQVEALLPFEKRIIVLREASSSLHLLLHLQNFFLRMLIWENELERIVLRKGTLDELLDASVPYLKNFIFISDNDFNVIAKTSAIEPPDKLHKGIIENGCLTPRTISEKRFRLPEKTFYTRKASELTPYDRVSYPVHLSHTYFGSVSMSCNSRSDTHGLRDMFRILLRYIRPVCERIWTQKTSLDTQSFFFFAKLIEHEEITANYLSSQLEVNKLPAQGMYKAILFDVDPSIDPDLAYAITRAAERIHGGNVRCFPYQHAVIALCFSEGNDSALSHKRTIDEVTERIFFEYGIDAGVSSVFTNIRDLDLAYRQARIALGFRESIGREREVENPSASKGVYLFEDALLYYLIDPTGKDARFMRFIFDASIISVLWEEDLANGTNYVALLWHYLKTERNATDAAAIMHMHRNTVLYHIDKIQKRFDIDLNDKPPRDWLLLSFKTFFSTQSSESLASIFTDDLL